MLYKAKRYAEALTMAYRAKLGVDTAIARIFNTFGPRMRAHDGRAIPASISQALTNKPITVAGDGSQTRSVCYVDDLIDGILRLLYSRLPGPVNIGNPNEMSVLDLALLIRQLTGSSSEITFVPRPQDDPTVRQPEISLARNELGWKPRVRLEDGLRRTIRWLAGKVQPIVVLPSVKPLPTPVGTQTARLTGYPYPESIVEGQGKTRDVPTPP